MPVETDRLAHTLRIVLQRARYGIRPHDHRLHVSGHGDVLRRADVEVELSVGTEREELPEMAGLSRRVEAVDDDLGLRRIVQLVLDAVVTRDAIALGDVERALVERDSVRGVEALENG